ncbi:L-lactate permease [Dysgonomonas macrotermitis]|uniref:L-lactate permease n=1 Tax=Dysgonomonas macrotermitis TaxID=1346286 RepID=A0A1M4SYG0_9BACT|nr:L-lactate permease [Dysgonomonas macrotermitis]SHE37231.1 lactate permease [Dysgonomonas macrotermitis]
MVTLLNIILQNTALTGNLDVSWGHVAFAIIPVLLLIVLMGFLKMAGDKSALITLATTIVLALFAFGFPIADTGLSFVYGVLKAIFPILIIIIMAIFSYNVLVKTGKMEVLKEQFSSISSDKCIQVLLLTWGFGGLLEGMAGFGTAVAIPAAILISLGFKPIFSAVASLIANSVATGFGAVGTPVKVLAEQAGVTDVQTLSTQVVLQLSPLMILIPFVLVFMTDPRIKALPKHILLSVIVGVVSLVTQYIAARYMGAETPAILGSIASIIAIIVYAKLTSTAEDKELKAKFPKRSFGEIINAWSVYGFILILVILTSPLLPLRNELAPLLSTTFKFNIFDAVTNAEVVRSVKISWLIDAGVLLFLGSILGGLVQGAKIVELIKLLGTVIKQQRKTIVTVCSLIALSSIMDFSGMISQLGLALAIATGSLYPLFAPTIGCLGTFLTGSDTSSNILFGKLQASVAHTTGADPSWLAAANTAGATGGKIISPQSIAVATSACGLQGREGEIMKKAIPYALGYIIVAGLMVYLVPKIMGTVVF